MRSTFVTLLLLTEAVVSVLGHYNGMWSLTRRKREFLRRTKRRWVLSTIELLEEDSGPFPKEATQLFNDNDIDNNIRYRISGTGVTEPPTGVFTINEESGVVYVHKPIDRETYPIFHIKFDVFDKQTNRLVDNTLQFDVMVKDINDNAPVFEKAVIVKNISEATVEGVLPVVLQATDADDENEPNSFVVMSLVKQEPKSPKIGLVPVKGTSMYQLTLSGCFDYDKVKQFLVYIEAKDKGKPALSSTATVTLNIQDANTHQPVFTQSKYATDVMESVSNKEILRLQVDDKDVPNTPASLAVYKIIKGNEDGNYKIETDPNTNEGVLTVIKGKDYERTTLTTLQIAVENQQPLFVCQSGGPGGPVSPAVAKAPQTVSVNVSVIDVNDPPEFKDKTKKVFIYEENEPGEVLYTPNITDVDSDVRNIRYALAQDPAKWVTIDSKTGSVRTLQRMDRESPYVNNSIYTILIHAIDDGKPPATATGTLLVHLGDINDNSPYLESKHLVLCGNKHTSVHIKAKDKDEMPYAGPFAFSLRGHDVKNSNQWKLDPDTGESTTLHSVKILPYGNYSVPLTITDNHDGKSEDNVHVAVCDCGSGTTCRSLQTRSSMLDVAAIAALIAGLLMFLLFLLCGMKCDCGDKMHAPLSYGDMGAQSLIKYNEEGGGSKCQADPALLLTSTSAMATTDGIKSASGLVTQAPMPNIWASDFNGTLKSQGRYKSTIDRSTYEGRQFYDTQRSTRRGSSKRAFRNSRTQSTGSEWNIEEHISQKLEEIKENESCEYFPHIYAYEGEDTEDGVLDQLPVDNWESMDFLKQLGPKFNTLGGVCQHEDKMKVSL